MRLIFIRICYAPISSGSYDPGNLAKPVGVPPPGPIILTRAQLMKYWGQSFEAPGIMYSKRMRYWPGGVVLGTVKLN